MRVEIRSRRRGVRHFVFLFPKCRKIVYRGGLSFAIEPSFFGFFFSRSIGLIGLDLSLTFTQNRRWSDGVSRQLRWATVTSLNPTQSMA